MYALGVRRIAGPGCFLSFLLVAACGSPESKSASSTNNPVGYSGAAGFAGVQAGSGGIAPAAGGFGGAASGAGIMGAGGIVATGGVAPATGGTLPMGTGGVVDPGPAPTGQILDCRGTGPCRIDDGDACCIGANATNGTVTSISENCIPPNASCDYPFTIARCDGPEDCRASDVCCGTLHPFGNVQLFGEVACESANTCVGDQKFVVCRQGITVCPAGKTCGPFPTLPSDISVCR